MAKTILIVEDEKNIVDILSFNLGREGYATLEAYDGEAGLQLALEQDPDLILLDLMLPKRNGFDVCRSVREHGRATPIIMLTAREEETDKVLGLELGADDYITKPFSMRELLARVKANIRRVGMLTDPAQIRPSAASRLEQGRIAIDTELLMAYKDGAPLELTQREYELLKFLASNPGKVFSTKYLYESVWQESAMGNEGAVAVHIRHLREKIEINPSDPRYLKVVWGQGYKMEGGRK